MRILPKAISNVRQGKRKRDRWGPCRNCGTPAALRCARCHSWRCANCVAIRQVPRRIGFYAINCLGGCRQRMHPEIAKLIREGVAR